MPWLGFGVALCALTVAGTATVTSQRVGYVDSSRLLEGYEGATEARAQLAREQQTLEANVRVLSAELDSLRALFGARPGFADLTRLREKETEVNRYAQAAVSRLAEREDELMQPVFGELNAQVERFAKAEGVDLVLGTTAGGNILYGGRGTDLTDGFLRYLADAEQ